MVEEKVWLKDILSMALAGPLLGGPKSIVDFSSGHHEKQFCKTISIWTIGSHVF